MEEVFLEVKKMEYIDDERLVRNRIGRKLFYNTWRYGFFAPLARMCLDINGGDKEKGGLENLPDRSCMLANHHCFSFDWMALCYLFDKKVHGWFDTRVFNPHKRFCELGELIPVRTQFADARRELRGAYELVKKISKVWFDNTNEIVMANIDGPSELSIENGKVVELEERKMTPWPSNVVMDIYQDSVKRGGIREDIPILTYSAWVPEQHRDSLFVSHGLKQAMKYLFRNRKIPYFFQVSEPIYPSDFKNKRELAEEVKNRQIEGYNGAKGRGMDYLKRLRF